jgi:hypothetical protein
LRNPLSPNLKSLGSYTECRDSLIIGLFLSVGDVSLHAQESLKMRDTLMIDSGNGASSFQSRDSLLMVLAARLCVSESYQ